MLVFISLFNLAVWIVLTFQSQSYYSTAIGAEAFGKMQWVVLQRFLLPLAIFFRHGCQMAIARFYRSYVFGPSGFWTMALLRCAAKFDPFLSLDCPRVEGIKFCHLATVEAHPLYLPLAGGKVKKSKSGKNRLIVSVAANPKTCEDVFGKGPYTHT